MKMENTSWRNQQKSKCYDVNRLEFVMWFIVLVSLQPLKRVARVR